MRPTFIVEVNGGKHRLHDDFAWACVCSTSREHDLWHNAVMLLVVVTGNCNTVGNKSAGLVLLLTGMKLKCPNIEGHQSGKS